jgi:choline kinase
MAKVDNTMAKVERTMAKVDNTMAKEEYIMVKEDNTMAKEEYIMVKEDNTMAKEDNTKATAIDVDTPSCISLQRKLARLMKEPAQQNQQIRVNYRVFLL